MAEKGLRRLQGVKVPQDLLAEPECNTDGVWILPIHNNPKGQKCDGSASLVYNTGLTRERPARTVCDSCSKSFSE